MIVGITLAIMVMLTLLSIVFGSDFASVFISTKYEAESIVDGVRSVVVGGNETGNVVFGMNELEGAIPILGVMLVIVLLLGITVVATGLSGETVKIAVYLTFYIGLWVLLSSFSESLIRSIDIFGALIYITLTIGYTIGVIQNLSGAGGND